MREREEPLGLGESSVFPLHSPPLPSLLSLRLDTWYTDIPQAHSPSYEAECMWRADCAGVMYHSWPQLGPTKQLQSPISILFVVRVSPSHFTGSHPFFLAVTCSQLYLSQIPYSLNTLVIYTAGKEPKEFSWPWLHSCDAPWSLTMQGEA